METIEKHHDVAANAIIDSYLLWAQGQRWYGTNCGKILYEELRNKSATGTNNRHRLIDEILLPEQNNRCCYCMRYIVDHMDSASIEHIIPQHTATPAQMNKYFSPRSGGLNIKNVCLTSDYVIRGSVKAPYPHHVAYHNFAVACKNCNSKRGHNEIDPFFLFAGISNEVIYDQQTGKVEWPLDSAYANPSPELPTLEKIDLNNPLLKAIRVVWFYAKKLGVDPDAINREELIYGAIGESLDAYPGMSDDEFNAYLNLTTDEMWKLLLKFDYFGK